MTGELTGKCLCGAVNNTREGMASLRCGILDNSASVVPVGHLWVRSRQPWIGLPEGTKAMDEQPRTNEEWIAQVGIA